MELYRIRTYPDEFLRKPTKPVENIDDSIQEIIDRMAATMYAAPGTGLAAIQVGIGKSIIIYDISPSEEERSLQVLVNPRIVEQEGRITFENEGCLSVPDYRSNVKRYESVVVEAMDRNEKPVKIETEGFHAVVLQHEIDHLNGILFVDRLSLLKREMFKKRWKKQQKTQN